MNVTERNIVTTGGKDIKGPVSSEDTETKRGTEREGE